MEYGCGGCTKMAVPFVKTLISVENDVLFSKALKNNIHADDAANDINISLNHQTLGPSGKWGHPVFTLNTPAYNKRRDAYVSKPWDELRRIKGEDTQPDLILVDGRFRMACALHSLAQLPEGSETTFFFHDYNTRPIYHDMEAYIDVQQRLASTVIFKRKSGVSQAEYTQAFFKHGHIWQ